MTSNASLPMYNLPEMRADNAGFGEALQELLRAHDRGLIRSNFLSVKTAFGHAPKVRVEWKVTTVYPKGTSQLQAVTAAVVEAARENLVIGTA